MDCLSRTLKRGYAAVFGGSPPKETPSKERKTRKSQTPSPQQEQEDSRNVIDQPSLQPSIALSNRKIAQPRRKKTSEQSSRKSTNSPPPQYSPSATAREYAAPSVLQFEDNSSLHPPTKPLPVYAAQDGLRQPLSRNTSRMIMATEPGQARPALLMNEELFEAIKNSVADACEYSKTDHLSNVYLGILANFQEYARCQLDVLYERDRRPMDHAALAHIYEQINGLRHKLDLATQEESSIRKALAEYEKQSFVSFLKASMLLEGVFVCQGMLKLPDADASKPDGAFVAFFAVPESVEETESEVAYKQHMDAVEQERALGCDEKDYHPGSWDQEAYEEYEREAKHETEQDALHDLEVSRKQLQEARTAFETRNRESAASFYGRHQDCHRIKPREEDLLSYDHKQFEYNNRLTRDIINAEEQYAKAKLAVKEMKLNITTASQTSGFEDADGDANPDALLSGVNHAAVGFRSGKVMRWVESLPAAVAYDGPAVEVRPMEPEMDEWVAEPVGNSDSASMVEYGSFKEKIESVKAAGASKRSAAVSAWCETYGRKRDLFERMHTDRKGV